MNRRTFLKSASTAIATMPIAAALAGELEAEMDNYVLEQQIQIPAKSPDSVFLFHGYRPTWNQTDDGRITCLPGEGPLEYKRWIAFGELQWGIWDKSRTLHIRNFDDLSESRDITFPDNGKHGGICDTIYDYKNQCLYCLHFAPNNISWIKLGDMSHGILAETPHCSNGKLGLHNDHVYLVTQTDPTNIYKFTIRFDGPVQPAAHTTMLPPGCHSMAFWNDWMYVTYSQLSSNAPLQVIAVNSETCEPMEWLTIPEQFCGTHEMAVVQTCDSDATLFIGVEGWSQNANEQQALVALSLSDYSHKFIYPDDDESFQQPIWGIRFDGRYVWVTYGCDFGGVYAAYDPVTWQIKKWIQLPPEMSFANGGLAVIGNEAVGTRFAFEQPGQPSTMFRIKF